MKSIKNSYAYEEREVLTLEDYQKLKKIKSEVNKWNKKLEASQTKTK
ncbi:MAG: hypothetical protein LBR43_03555 [Spiroplasmataceae bacterium]|nr:hypothetical protein [Spiroplasmataceae bacterium]